MIFFFFFSRRKKCTESINGYCHAARGAAADEKVRLVIWKCKDVVSADFLSGLNDLYVKAWVESCESQVFFNVIILFLLCFYSRPTDFRFASLSFNLIANGLR